MTFLQHVKKSASFDAISKSDSNQVVKANVLLNEYTYWLNRKVNSPTPYLTVAKSVIKSISGTGNLKQRIDQEVKSWAGSMKAFHKKFLDFLTEQEVVWVFNDLDGIKLPIGGPLVKLYLLHTQDTVRSKASKSTYATLLNAYMELIQDDPAKMTKRSVAKFIQDQDLSDYTRRLYVSVVKSFIR